MSKVSVHLYGISGGTQGGNASVSALVAVGKCQACWGSFSHSLLGFLFSLFSTILLSILANFTPTFNEKGGYWSKVSGLESDWESRSLEKHTWSQTPVCCGFRSQKAGTG